MLTVKDQLARLVTRAHEALFRATQGRLGGRVMGMPVLILFTTGRVSGKKRSTMLTTPVREGDRLVLVGSFGGDPREPRWVRNLRDNPDVEVMMHGKVRPMKARVASSDEKAELWPRVVAAYKGYGAYQKRTDRDIPLVIVEP